MGEVARDPSEAKGCQPVVISTVVLNWNRADLLAKTLRSYLATVSVPYELFVVDNGSTDDSRAVIENIRRDHPEVKAILLDKNVGGFALNLGLEKATGRYLHISENDLEYLPGWDTCLIDKFHTFSQLGQLSVFAPQIAKGEIWANKPVTPLELEGKTIFLADINVGASSIIRREIWDLGLRWGNLYSEKCLFPDDFGFSTGVKALGYQMAWNDKYVVVNWGHQIEEMKSRPEYYAQNYASKSWVGLEGFQERLQEQGYELVRDFSGAYQIGNASRSIGARMRRFGSRAVRNTVRSAKLIARITGVTGLVKAVLPSFTRRENIQWKPSPGKR
jgi:glycosyltransferase involved in cell wall biosynthesis